MRSSACLPVMCSATPSPLLGRRRPPPLSLVRRSLPQQPCEALLFPRRPRGLNTRRRVAPLLRPQRSTAALHAAAPPSFTSRAALLAAAPQPEPRRKSNHRLAPSTTARSLLEPLLARTFSRAAPALPQTPDPRLRELHTRAPQDADRRGRDLHPCLASSFQSWGTAHHS
jgi:hypothetical protein